MQAWGKGIAHDGGGSSNVRASSPTPVESWPSGANRVISHTEVGRFTPIGPAYSIDAVPVAPMSTPMAR